VSSAINNAFYDTLGERWYTAQDDPVALLRAEAAHRNPWILKVLEHEFPGRKCKILDVACGAGFLSNPLAKAGHEVVGIDASPESLEVARRHDDTGSVLYQNADALALPFQDGHFDAVALMDFLEHVEDPEAVLAEASRVLSPGGLLFFHTFNRNFLSRLVVIHGVEWFVANTPPRMHVYHLFIKPEELRNACRRRSLAVQEIHGSRPRLTVAFWKMLFTRRVPEDFSFTFTRSTAVAYTGFAKKV